MQIPKHVGFIMDGNGRWAQSRGLPRSAGHRAGFERIPHVLESCAEIGVQVVSGYAWSTENWGRPKNEVDYIMRSLNKELPRFTQELHKRGVRFVVSGSRERINPEGLQVLDEAIALTSHNNNYVFNLVFNYGGRDEIIHAVRQLLTLKPHPEGIDEKLVEKYLWTAGLPPVDLVIRTGGESRISNFMLWQCAFACLYIVNEYWPAIDKEHIKAGIDLYNRTIGADS
jgi:undecaprenyl diphosphate synthase